MRRYWPFLSTLALITLPFLLATAAPGSAEPCDLPTRIPVLGGSQAYMPAHSERWAHVPRL
jgi:hypothetical protein